MMKFAVAMCVLVAAAHALEPLSDEQHTYLFSKWMSQYSKTYQTSELLTRYNNFKTNLEQIRNHNEQYTAGSITHFLRINQFGDLSNDEFKAHFNGYNVKENAYIRSQNTRTLDVSKLAATQDWVGKMGANGQAVVTPVKNQGQCGSCWSFSSTGGLEGACTMATTSASDAGWGGPSSQSQSTGFFGLSEQQLVDCSTAEGNQGCNGGLMDDAFEYIINVGKGLTTEAQYPYSATGPNTCESAGKSPVLCPAKAYKNVPTNSPRQMAAFLAAGPVSIAVDASGFGWQFYGGGVMSTSCGTQLDHGVLAVGYGSNFWKVKNSWAATWGEQGFIQLGADPLAQTSSYNNGAGQCGILTSASVPCMDAQCSAIQ